MDRSPFTSCFSLYKAPLCFDVPYHYSAVLNQTIPLRDKITPTMHHYAITVNFCTIPYHDVNLLGVRLPMHNGLTQDYAATVQGETVPNYAFTRPCPTSPYLYLASLHDALPLLCLSRLYQTMPLLYSAVPYRYSALAHNTSPMHHLAKLHLHLTPPHWTVPERCNN